MKWTLGDNEGNFIMIKGLLHQDNTEVIDVHTPEHRALQHVKQRLTELKGEVVNLINNNNNNNGTSQYPISITDNRKTRQTTMKETDHLNSTNRLNLTFSAHPQQLQKTHSSWGAWVA